MSLFISDTYKQKHRLKTYSIFFSFQHRFTCRSVEYNYVTLQCQLSDSDRRTTGQFVQFVDAQGVDYFENLCLKGNYRTFSVS